MAVAFKAAGTGFALTEGGDLAPTCPATVDAGDVLVAHLLGRGTAGTGEGHEGYEIAAPSGWTLVSGPNDMGAKIAYTWAFARIADGTEDGTGPVFSSAAITNDRWGRIYSFSGYVSGSITDVIPAASVAVTTHGTDPQMPTITTTVAGSLAVALVAQVDDNAQGDATGETGGDWTEATAEFLHNAFGTDCGMGIQTCTPTADPGTVSGGSIATANDPAGVIGFEIRPNAPGVAAEFVPRALLL